MTGRIRFSVVMPLYNKAAYVADTLRAVLAQRHADLEVLVVDDGSTDDSVAIVQRFADPRVRLLQPGRGGVSRARNHGIAQATGNWVAFCDADDVWHRDHLATIANTVRRYPEVGMAATTWQAVPDGDPRWQDASRLCKAMPPAEPIRIMDIARRLRTGTPFLCTSSLAVRRDLLLQLAPAYAEGETRGEDIDLWFRLNALTDCLEIPVSLVDYRDAAVNSLSREVLSGVVKTGQYQEAGYLLRAEASARNGSAPAWQRGSLLSYVDAARITLARDALAAGQRRAAAGLLWRARAQAGTKRWWLTVLMTALLPRRWTAAWQAWRVRRTHPVVAEAAGNSAPQAAAAIHAPCAATHPLNARALAAHSRTAHPVAAAATPLHPAPRRTDAPARSPVA